MEIGISEAVLVATAFLVAFGNAVLGATGGLLLAVMATAFPPPLIIPAHAAIEAARNGLAWWRLRRRVTTQIVIAIGVGSLVAVGLAAPFTRVVPAAVQAVLIGAFLIWACWWPAPDPGRRFDYRLPLLGGLTGACSVFLGETGPLVRPFIADEPIEPSRIPGTLAAVMTCQHGFKVVAFTVIGAAYLPLIPLLAAMMAAGALGTAIGERATIRLPGPLISLGIRLVVTALAIRLIVVDTGLL